MQYTIEQIKKDPRTKSRAILAFIKVTKNKGRWILGLDGNMDYVYRTELEQAIKDAYKTGKHRSPSHIKREYASIVRFLKNKVIIPNK